MPSVFLHRFTHGTYTLVLPSSAGKRPSSTQGKGVKLLSPPLRVLEVGEISNQGEVFEEKSSCCVLGVRVAWHDGSVMK